MKELTYFYLKRCPHCKKADAMIDELLKTHPEFAQVPLNRIEEEENAALANSYDYYYVPCFWVGETKLMEGVPSMEAIENAFTFAMEA